ncbi:MAG: hypothetical protein ACE5HS_12745 [bacterium]
MNMKLSLVIVLLSIGFGYWLLPKTRLARYFKMNETLFNLTNVLGVVCGATGLVISFGWPNVIMEKHLFEIILLPVLMIYAYWAIIMKVKKSNEIIDEKQEYNMTKAAATTMGYSFMTMFFIFALYQEKVFQGAVFYPLYFFMSLSIYSASTLFYFKRN